MLDCRTIRERLERRTLSDAREDGGDADVAAHLETCVECSCWAKQVLSFDQQLSRRLAEVPVPLGLQERLLVMVESELENDPAVLLPFPNESKNEKFSRQGWKGKAVRFILGAVAAGLIVAVSLTWSTPDQLTSFTYSEIRSTLLEYDRQEDWESFSPFDNGFSVTQLDSSLRRWQLDLPQGIDFDNDQRHDVAVYHFQYRKWSGELVVIPSQLADDVPAVPQSRSGSPLLEWSDGELTYLCFVDSGSVEGLRDELFGRMG